MISSKSWSATTARSMDEIEEIAANWFARRQAGLDVDEEVDYNKWLAADQRNVAAMAHLEITWATVSYPTRVGQADVAKRRLAGRERHRTRRRAFHTLAIGGMAAAAAVVVALWPGRPAQLRAPTPITAVHRPDVRTLADGSTVQLNAGAEIVVTFSADQRRVRLIHGEALFVVMKDVTRPFVVSAGAVEVRAVGTAFSVRHAPTEVDVLVTQGSVAVQKIAVSAGSESSFAATIAPLQLSAGARVVLMPDFPVLPATAVRSLTLDEIETVLAWRRYRIEFTRTPLAEAVAWFNRQDGVKLALADSATGDLQISGIFWTNDSEGFVRLLETGLHIRAERSADSIMLREAR